MDNSIFKTKEVFGGFQTIINDIKTGIKKYGFKRVGLDKIIHTTGNIQYLTGLKLLRLYNSYFNLNLEIEDLFNMSFLMRNERKPRFFEFIHDSSKNTEITRFIGEVLARKKSA